MKKNLVLIFLIFLCELSFSQTRVRYLNELNSLSPEVPKEQAQFSRTTIKNYEVVTIEDFDLKRNRLVGSKTYKSGVPFGIWKVNINNKLVELDYDFETTYMKSKEELCLDSILMERLGSNLFEDDKREKYIAPKLKNDMNVYEFIGKQLIYPPDASKYGISGKVYIQFEMDKEGSIHNILLAKGQEKHLDKEAERIIRSLKFSSPAYLDGKPIELCIIIPIRFTPN